MNTRDMSFWLSCLGGLLTQFKSSPKENNQLAMTHAMHEYQAAITNGLLRPKMTTGEPWRRAANLSDWYRLQLDDALICFQINPTDERFKAIEALMKEYRDAVFTGKVKP